MKMIGGTLKYWNGAGYGFIKPDDGGDDIFFHVSALQREGRAAPPEKGTRVWYNAIPNPKYHGRLMAQTVKLD